MQSTIQETAGDGITPVLRDSIFSANGNDIMRTFSSYGPIDKDLHFHVPREELIESAYRRLIGEDPERGGHYITVWVGSFGQQQYDH